METPARRAFSPVPISLIRLAVTARHRERRTAETIAIDARQHDAGQPARPLIERNAQR